MKNNLGRNLSGFALECGCDEAGRGCLAGPVVAAAVILADHFECAQLTDSKQLKKAVREDLRTVIEQNALDWAVAFVDNTEIDAINILNASILAMHNAIDKLNITPEFLIIDGNRFIPYKKIPYQTIVKGDAKYLSIAAASVLAKTHRDEFMEKLHAQFPCYQWNRNMGYPTEFHRAAIAANGLTPFHRTTFDWTGEKKKNINTKRKRKNIKSDNLTFF
ncbi:MAG: ribonuclease HII [Prevotellaceae bacterium]|jgi:ribonuclease HII|nr:ribonuclease HII [Prevotellaceae bacterium]